MKVSIILDIFPPGNNYSHVKPTDYRFYFEPRGAFGV